MRDRPRRRPLVALRPRQARGADRRSAAAGPRDRRCRGGRDGHRRGRRPGRRAGRPVWDRRAHDLTAFEGPLAGLATGLDGASTQPSSASSSSGATCRRWCTGPGATPGRPRRGGARRRSSPIDGRPRPLPSALRRSRPLAVATAFSQPANDDSGPCRSSWLRGSHRRGDVAPARPDRRRPSATSIRRPTSTDADVRPDTTTTPGGGTGGRACW